MVNNKDKRGKGGRPAESNATGANGAGTSGSSPNGISSVERLQQSFEQLAIMFEEEKKAFREREVALKQEMKGLQDEKAAMTSKAIKKTDIININVGGTIMAATRSTLCQYPSSLLAYMFSGRWDDQLLLDTDGAVFLDFDPELFSTVLNWLRMQSLAGPSSVMAEVQVPCGKEEDMMVLVDYLQLQPYMPMWFDETFSPTLHSPAISINSALAERQAGNGNNYAVAVSSHSYFDVCVELTIEIEQYDCEEPCTHHPIFIGIVAKDTTMKHDLSTRWDLTWQATAFGWWVRPGQSYQVEAGRSRKLKQSSLWEEGDSVKLTLDCRKAGGSGTTTLRLGGLPKQEERQIGIDPSSLDCSEEWLLVVGLTKQGTQVKLGNARRQGMPAWQFR